MRGDGRQAWKSIYLESVRQCRRRSCVGHPDRNSPEKQAILLREIQIAFLFAPHHHPALRHASQARRELGVRTIFNALGPICNPGNATHQLIGVYDDGLRPMLAEVLRELGSERAWIVRSEDGLDEISPSAPTRVSELFNGKVAERVIVPEDFGFVRMDRSVLAGGSPEENAIAIETIVQGEVHPASDAVLLNAAAALVVSREALSPKEATEMVRDAVKSGRSGTTLENWRKRAKAAEGS